MFDVFATFDWVSWLMIFLAGTMTIVQ
jgi:hypothetical protein